MGVGVVFMTLLLLIYSLIEDGKKTCVSGRGRANRTHKDGRMTTHLKKLFSRMLITAQVNKIKAKMRA
jgi:hypothetical protein